MSTNSTVKFIRQPEVLSSLSISKSTLYLRIKDGTFPPPIAIGINSLAWADREVQEIMKALLSGKSANEIRSIVAELVNQRKAG